MIATRAWTDSAQNAIRREIEDYPRWWSGLRLWRKLLPGGFVLAYWLSLAALGGFRSDHVTIGVLIVVLGYAGRSANHVLRFLLPVFLTGIVYDSQRYYSEYIRGEIHVEFPYFFDKRFFGIATADGAVLTPNEWWQRHTRPFLDLITGFFYLFFIAIYVLVCAYHSFVYPRWVKDPELQARVRRVSPYVTWAFFWVNLIGYSTYYWFPAAPPWYVADYGLGPAKLDTPASAAGCIRFDQLLGTHFFTGMYGRAADVFGAIPSLHVAYPFLSFLFALQFRSLRAFCLCFYLIMCFSAVYLNHHYILDILWGTGYAILVWVALNRWTLRTKPQPRA